MAQKKISHEELTVRYRLGDIQVEQFAVIEDKYDAKNDAYKLSFEAGFSRHEDVLMTIMKASLLNEGDMFAMIEVVTAYLIHPEDLHKIKSGEGFKMPGPMAHGIASVSLGILRGIFFEKCNNILKEVSIIPLLNLHDFITLSEDVIVE